MKFPNLDGKFILAPMSGVSDVAFRAIARNHGAAMTYTEFCSAEGLVRGNEGTIKQFYIDPDESPVGIQLFGSDMQTVQQAAQMAEGKADVVDFNLGCPAWHVLNQGCGSALLGEPEKVAEIVRDASSVLSKPFTVKLRTGLSDSRRNFLDVAQRCVDAGAVAVALHGRTTKQGYSGKADWDAIKELKEHFTGTDIPIIGNGDIFAPEDGVRMLEHTGCDYAMIGRGAQRNPFIFRQANELLETGSYREISDAHKVSLVYEYKKLAEKYDLDFFRVKTHAMSLTKGIHGAKYVRGALSKAKTLSEIDAALELVS